MNFFINDEIARSRVYKTVRIVVQIIGLLDSFRNNVGSKVQRNSRSYSTKLNSVLDRVRQDTTVKILATPM